MAVLTDILPTAQQTLVSSSAYADVYIGEAVGFVIIPLAFIFLAGIIGMVMRAFHFRPSRYMTFRGREFGWKRRNTESWLRAYDDLPEDQKFH